MWLGTRVVRDIRAPPTIAAPNFETPRAVRSAGARAGVERVRVGGRAEAWLPRRARRIVRVAGAIRRDEYRSR